MDSKALHWMARRYLMDRYDELSNLYAQLPNQGRAADGFRYQARARRIFPRYNVVEAMLVEVERLDPERLPDLHALAHAVAINSDFAVADMLSEPKDSGCAMVSLMRSSDSSNSGRVCRSIRSSERPARAS